MITLDGRLRRLERRNRALCGALAAVVIANFGAVGALWLLRAPQVPGRVATPEQPLAAAPVTEPEPTPIRAAATPEPSDAPERLIATAIDLIDDAGIVRARLRIDPNSGAGLFESLDAEGDALAVLGPGSLRLANDVTRAVATLDAGRLRLDGDGDGSAFELGRGAAGRITMTLDDPDGRRALSLESGPAGARFVAHLGGDPAVTIEHGAITLVGPEGGARLVGGALELAGSDSGVGASIDARAQGGRLELANATGEVVARLGAGDAGDGEIETFDHAGRRLASIVATADGQGGLFAFNALGNLAMQLAADESGDGVLRVNNRLGQSRFILTTGQRDEASMFTVDVRGRLIPVLGAAAAARRASADDGEASR